MKAFLLALIFIPSLLIADMPGNKPRPSGSLQVVNCSAFPNYVFQVTASRGPETAVLLHDSTVVKLLGGYGSPVRYELSAIRKDRSDTLPIKTYWSFDGNVVLRIDSISGDSAVFTTRQQMSATDKEKKRRKGFGLPMSDSPNNSWMLPVVSAFAGLSLLFVWRRRSVSQLLSTTHA